jgi:CheY-like chemotaxis protein
MTNKTRVLNVRIVGFSAPEKQMLNSIFLLSVAPARQIGYKLWNSESGTAPDMYLLDGDSESAVASWQAAFTNTADRTLVVGSKNTDLGVASAARPLGLKVVGAMDRLAIALSNLNKDGKLAKESAGHDVSAPAAGTLPTGPGATLSGTTITGASNTGATNIRLQPPPAKVADTGPASHPKQNTSLPRVDAAPPAPAAPPAMSASLNASLGSLSVNTVSSNAQTMSATVSAALPATHAGTLPTSMTAAAPAATVLPHVTLQPNISPPLHQANADKALEKSINEKSLADKPVTEKAVERILSEKAAVDKPATPKVEVEKTAAEKIQAAAANLMASGVTPLSPAALSAVVGTSATRSSLRVVPSASPMAASLPSATSTHARIADAPMTAAPPVTSRIAEAPMGPPPSTVTPAPAPVASAPIASAPAPAAVPLSPAAPASAMPSAAPPTFVPGAPTARHEEQVFRVLAVDDSPLMRTFLQNKLAPYGISPEFAASGEEALFKISKQHFDMIFLDVMLPGMDGYDVCKMIKKNKDNNLMKVVMLTSKDKTFDRIRGTMAGCDGYLTKPVDEIKLRAIIERHTVTRK